MEWLYPELKRTNPNDRSSALREAKASSFDAIELVGIGIALVLAVVVTRYSATGLVALGRIGAALGNFMVAIPVLLVFAGPLYARRVREAFANTLKNVRGLKQIKLDRDMISASDSSKVHRPTAAMQSNAPWRLLAVGSTGHCNTALSLSAGVSNPKVFLGRWFKRNAILFEIIRASDFRHNR